MEAVQPTLFCLASLATALLKGANEHQIATWEESTLDLCFSGHFDRWSFVLAGVDFPISGADFLHHRKLIMDLAADCLIAANSLYMLGSTEGHSNILAAVHRTPPQVRDVLAQFLDVINKSGDLSSIKHMMKHMLETAGCPVTAQFRGLSPPRTSGG